MGWLVFVCNYPNEVVYFMRRKNSEARNFFHHFYFSLFFGYKADLPASKRRVNCIFVNSPSTTPPWLIYTCIKQAQINTAKGMCACSQAARWKTLKIGADSAHIYCMEIIHAFTEKNLLQLSKESLALFQAGDYYTEGWEIERPKREKNEIIHQNHNFLDIYLSAFICNWQFGCDFFFWEKAYYNTYGTFSDSILISAKKPQTVEPYK